MLTTNKLMVWYPSTFDYYEVIDGPSPGSAHLVGCAFRLGDRGQALFGGRLLQWARNPDLGCPASPSLVRGGVRMRSVRSLLELVSPR
ncbi:unnamed protein product [Leptosia nina]|uniref:Uncharacterized protein n=1 Tax=Leptosia nina TaxID=320188 RepID=A0AAV1K1R3_9NEOP